MNDEELWLHCVGSHLEAGGLLEKIAHAPLSSPQPPQELLQRQVGIPLLPPV